jgi:hypothetical protein
MMDTMPPPSYLPEILAAISWAPSWLQGVVGVLYVLLTRLGPAAALLAFGMWLMHRDSARTIRQIHQRTQRTHAILEDWRQEIAAQKRLHEIQDQLWLDRLSPDVRVEILDSRRQIAERERVAQEILRQEQAAEATSRNGSQPGCRGES